MLTTFYKKSLFFSLIMSIFTPSSATIQIGQPAPDFTLINQYGENQTLSDYRGQWVVLYFYPKDDTPGCTTEACNFRDAINHIIAKRAIVFGISLDDKKSHEEFSKKYKLPFSILSDTDGVVAKKYDSLRDYWILKLAKRNSFIVGPTGNIIKIYKDVDPQTHVTTILKDLTSLKTTD
jgi:peroxiredoxin Q/BCP